MNSDAKIHEIAEAHRKETGHEIAVRPGYGWVCSNCDPDIYEEFISPDYDKTAPVVRRIPHSRYPDWPGKVEVDFTEGRAFFRNDHDGSSCELFIGYGPGHSGAFTLAEMMVLRREMDKAIDELADLVAMYGENAQEAITPTEENTPRLTNPK